jgi:hypothetical protein
VDLDTCYTEHEGQAILVPGGGAGNEGQCAQWADTVYHDVYGLPYVYTPAAKDWWYNADSLGITQNFNKITDGSIKKGDFVVFNPLSSTDPQGHIDVAAQDGSTSSFVGYDSNWGRVYNAQGLPILHTVNHNDRFNQFIIGSLRFKKDEEPMLNAGDVQNMYISLLGHKADDQTAINWSGHTFKDLFYAIIQSEEFAARQGAQPQALPSGIYRVN